MRAVILTTETTHHAYFVREMAKYARIDWVLLESESKAPPFETSHPYEIERDKHERTSWFDGRTPGVGEFAKTWGVPCVNDKTVTRRLDESRPDIVFVFGTGRLQSHTIAACGHHVLNLHGGDPLKYRGLDSHLWSIYHRDFGSLVTTLHKVSTQLDRGDIINSQSLQIVRDMRLDELRRLNTEACVQLCRNALSNLREQGAINGRPQAEIGRYYSHMPAVLKSICVDRFAKYTRSLA